ncbi:Cysteine synthase 2, variant 4 [Entomophthora muscae]|uniref:Cysteine synthase 2, variant 4 n=1 Tax=Entomophthora muscae TaxID=34485 RepID=A0ACC2RYZ4_9FUNG|nr:Cysteine synthase 2, variant 4 [Entomophthora muscae]
MDSSKTSILVSGALIAGISITLVVQTLLKCQKKSGPGFFKRLCCSNSSTELEQLPPPWLRVKDGEEIKVGVEGLIGETPLVLIRSLSRETKCRILAKVEFLNPGGSTKDRVGKGLIKEAEGSGLLVPHQGYTVYEGTVGSTGISLAMICRARGYNCHIVMPDDQAEEKYSALRALGATVEKVRPASIVDPGHFVNVARARAAANEKGFFANQFENLANFTTHQTTTGREILRQTGGNIDAFVAGAGTGGTLSGVAHCLKERSNNIIIALADPQGSGLYHKVEHGTLYTPEQSEGSRRRHQVDTVVEGVGMTRLTDNLLAGFDHIDMATSVTDQQAVSMSRFLMANDGILLESM